MKFDLEKLKDANILDAFQATIGGKFAPLTILEGDEVEIDDDTHLKLR